jgi:hypothetical protein
MVKFVSGLRSIVDHDGAVILNSTRNQIITLDAMGGYIWERLQQGMSPSEIVRHLNLETGEAPDVVQQDVDELLSELQSRHLILDPELHPVKSDRV